MQLRTSFRAALLASLFATGAADAADLGRPAPVAVDYVKVCDAYGAGFFYIPGSETCLRIGGYVRADAAWQEPGFLLKTYFEPLVGRRIGPLGTTNLRTWNEVTTLARARIELDARTNTEYGLVRSFIQTHIQIGNSFQPFDSRTLAAKPAPYALDTTDLVQAFVQWGGLTAGRTFSFFNLPYFLTYSNPYTADQNVNLLGYQVSFGGLTAAVSLEDATERQSIIGNQVLIDPANPLAYGGTRMPDVIAALDYRSQFFDVKLAGALHQVIGVDERSFVNLRQASVEKMGYAVQLGARVRVPNVQGLEFYGGVAYAEGASRFAGLGTDDDRYGGASGFDEFDGSFRRVGFNGVMNGLDLVKATTAHIGAGWQFSPTWRGAASYGYADVKDVSRFGKLYDYDRSKALALVEWAPTAGLTVGLEGSYENYDFPKDKLFIPVTGGWAVQKLGPVDTFSALLRVQRRF